MMDFFLAYVFTGLSFVLLAGIAVFLDVFDNRHVPYKLTVPLLAAGILLGLVGGRTEGQVVLLAGVTWAVVFGMSQLGRVRGVDTIGDADAMVLAAFAPLLGWPVIAWTVVAAGFGAICYGRWCQVKTVPFVPFIVLAGFAALPVLLFLP